MNTLETTSQFASVPQAHANQKRVLFFDHTAQLGGGEIALLNLVKYLDRQRYFPIIVLASDGPLVQRFRDIDVEVHVMPLSADIVNTRKDALGASLIFRLKDVALAFAYTVRLAHFLRANCIDLVHTNSLKADLIGGVAARLARRPVIWHVRDRIAEDYLPSMIARAFRSLCRVIPNHVVTNSQATLRTIVRSHRSGTSTIPSGVDVEARMRVVHDGTSIENFEAPAATLEAPIIGLVGRISPWKGQHIFLEAAATVLKTYPAAQFQIIGSPLFNEAEYDRKIHQMVHDLGIEDHVEFTGFVNDVPRRISKLDILVHASTVGEPFGQVVIEGMAAGKPVVATAGGGVPEIVVDGVTGILVPMGNADAMARAIADLLANPQAAHLMGVHGRQRVIDQFSIQRTASLVQRLYDEILHRRGPLPLPARLGMAQ